MRDTINFTGVVCHGEILYNEFNMIPVIICGGVGTKMWPQSRQKSPKHFLPLFDGKSLFELNYGVLRKKFKPEEIYLQTNEVQAEIAKRLVPEIVIENVFIEPEMKNHGPATGFAAAQLVRRGLGDEPFMLVQADVLRQPEEKFLEMLDVCDKLVRNEGRMITGGIKPSYAIMGIDYLIRGEKVETGEGVDVYRVGHFLWRSTKEAAEEFVAGGVALTHSNHYCWTGNKLLDMYKRLKPEWYEPLKNIVEGGDVVTEYAKMPKGPIEDVTQHMFTEALVVELPFNWIDFGTWESLANYLGSDENNNFIRTNKYTAIIGLKDLVVVETDDALLILPKSESGRVGEVVDKLKEEGRTELL